MHCRMNAEALLHSQVRASNFTDEGLVNVSCRGARNKRVENAVLQILLCKGAL